MSAEAKRRFKIIGPTSPYPIKDPSPSVLRTSDAKVLLEAFPLVDAFWVNKVISGEFDFRTALRDRGLAPVADDESDTAEPCPVGTRPCPENCQSIKVWGLTERATEEEVLSLCRKFGAIKNVIFLKPEADGDLCCATVTFEKRFSALQAQYSLHRASFQDKELRVGWEEDRDEWESSSHKWLHVWIREGTTGQQLYRGFRRAGAPCTDARVVRESSAEEEQGVGAVAFRSKKEFDAIYYSLPRSTKTDWTRHPSYIEICT